MLIRTQSRASWAIDRAARVAIKGATSTIDISLTIEGAALGSTQSIVKTANTDRSNSSSLGRLLRFEIVCPKTVFCMRPRASGLKIAVYSITNTAVAIIARIWVLTSGYNMHTIVC